MHKTYSYLKGFCIFIFNSIDSNEIRDVDYDLEKELKNPLNLKSLLYIKDSKIGNGRFFYYGVGDGEYEIYDEEIFSIEAASE